MDELRGVEFNQMHIYATNDVQQVMQRAMDLLRLFGHPRIYAALRRACIQVADIGPHVLGEYHPRTGMHLRPDVFESPIKTALVMYHEAVHVLQWEQYPSMQVTVQTEIQAYEFEVDLWRKLYPLTDEPVSGSLASFYAQEEMLQFDQDKGRLDMAIQKTMPSHPMGQRLDLDLEQYMEDDA